MRVIWILLALAAPGFSGCSVLMARTGVPQSMIENEEQAERWFGKPTDVSATERGSIQTYHTRWLIANGARAAGNGMAFGMTFGFSEPLACANEVKIGAETLVYGRDLQFEFDDDGNEINYHSPTPERKEDREA